MRWEGSPRSLKGQAQLKLCSGKHHLLQGGAVHAFLRLREEAGANCIRNMSLDEINDEIDRTRKEIRYSDR